ncbi:hypothetical protein BGZ81_010926, partial [Podila clonocystis]
NAANPHDDHPNPEIQQLSTAPTLLLQQMASLSRHIAFQGFMQGTGTDIVLCAFSKTYHLHRLILAQSPFFDSMIHGPWKERAQAQIELTLDDPNITLEGFEIALGRMYGIWTVEADDNLAYARQYHEEEQEQKQPEFTVVFAGTQALYASRLTPANALAVLAAATYLGIESLCAQCTAYIIRTLSPARVVEYVRLCHRHSYHPWSSRIADACHTFLCRSGFNDPRVQCLGVFELLPVEWLPRVIGSDAFWVPSEWDRYLFCRRIVERRRRIRHYRERGRRKGGGSRHGKEKWDKNEILLDMQHQGAGDESYDDDPEEEDEEEEGEEDVYEKLFSTSIVYMHMTLEQLQLILNDHDPWTGRPFTPSHVVHESFWRQTEFRTLIESTHRKSAVLGLAIASRVVPQSDVVSGKYIRESDPIPEKDGIALTSAVLPFNDPKKLLNKSEKSVPPSQVYSACSPFRFSVQFEDVAQLDVGVRMSSNSFYYAGESGTQLGIYLHRLSTASPLPSTNRLRRPVFTPFPRGGVPPRPCQLPSPPSTPPKGTYGSNESEDDNDDLDQDEEPFEIEELCDLDKDTIPIEESFSCFPDRRESTRTWFRVYATSVGPLHQVTHFQAAPDDFRLLHSWGWKTPELYTTCYLPDLSQPPLDLDTACRGGFCDRRTRTRMQQSPTPGCQSAVYDMGGEDEEETCDCEARTKYGPHHHHRLPIQLKLSFVMGHI